MAVINADLIRKLREETGAPVMRAKQVLDQEGGDYDKAFAILQKEGFEKAAKREGRATSQGLIKVYTHHSNKVVGIVELLCETDFVAKNELFEELAHNIAIQVASMGTENILDQDFIKDPSKKIGDLVKEVIAKTGENVQVGRVVRMELGETQEDEEELHEKHES
jgi:elongation factor Ts